LAGRSALAGTRSLFSFAGILFRLIELVLLAFTVFALSLFALRENHDGLLNAIEALFDLGHHAFFALVAGAALVADRRHGMGADIAIALQRGLADFVDVELTEGTSE